MPPFPLRRPSTAAAAAAVALALASACAPALAQQISNLVFIGDSNTDSGRYAILPQYTSGATANVLNLHGSYTTPGGFMYSEYLGQLFGIAVLTTATPAPGGNVAGAATLAAGGNNFAAGNARISLAGNAVIGENAWSAQQQVAAYLASTGGVANPNTIYVVNIGTNDLKPTTPGGLGNVVNPGGVSNVAGLQTLALQTAAIVGTLQAAGARQLVVPNVASAPGSFDRAAWNAAGFNLAVGPYDQTWINSLNIYNQTAWGAIAGRGINFIPADIAAVGDYVLVHPGRFGITNTSILTPACGAVAAIDCRVGNLVAPNAMNTYFFADSIGHQASVVQKIGADYIYNLLVAPSEVSLLAETPIRSRAATVETFRSYLPAHLGAVGERRAWIAGEVAQTRLGNGFTGTDYKTSTPAALTVGMHYQATARWLLGGGLTAGSTRQSLGTHGHFDQSETAASLYAGYRQGPLSFNVIATAGVLDNQLRREVPLGIATESNRADAGGSNLSLAVQGGYEFASRLDAGMLTHGPLLGLVAQQARIDPLLESTAGGGVTALSYAGQKRRSAVTELGYQASLDLGAVRPFARVAWDHELEDGERTVTTTLTTVAAPGYSMAASHTGRDWFVATAGVRARLAADVTGHAVLTVQTGQSNASSYGASVGVSVAF